MQITAHNTKSMAWRKLPFWERVERQIQYLPWSGCHLYTGSLIGKGYGYAHDTKKFRLIHRASWERAFGEIPKNMMVCHTCDVPACCNPQHLFLGTALDNNRDREKKGRGNQNRGIKHVRPMAKLTWDDVRSIRAEFAAKGDERGLGSSLAKKYGIDHATLCSVRYFKTWKEDGR